MKIAGSVILRHLRASDGFVGATDGASPPVAVALRDGEDLVGWFRNPPPFEQHCIVFTDEGMVAGTAGEHRRIEYAELRDVTMPSKSPDAWGLVLDTTAGAATIVIGGRVHPGASGLNSFSLLNALRVLARG